MRRSAAPLNVISPMAALLYFWLSPDAVRAIAIPLFHFYIVTFTTFAAATTRARSEGIESQAKVRAAELVLRTASAIPRDISTWEQITFHITVFSKSDSLLFRIFDQNGRITALSLNGNTIEPVEGATPSLVEEHVYRYFTDGINGSSTILIVEPGQHPEQLTALDGTYALTTYTPILDSPGGAIIGVAEWTEPLPELTLAALLACRNALIIAAGTSAAFLLALFLVVRRGERILSDRAESVQIAYGQLQRSEAIRDDLTRMIVHDLRNPHSAITASLDLIRIAGADPGEQARFNELARDAAGRMSGLIEDIMTVSKYEAGELELHLEEVSMAGVVLPLVDSFRSQSLAEEKEFEIEVPPDLRARLDLPLITCVLGNLVGNAMKYIDSGSGRIAIRVFDTGAQVQFRVKDNGIGIPDAYKTTIFEKFVRVPDSDQAARRGSGLGLAFCRMVVETHGGAIRVEDSPGGGSTFIFWIPK